MPATRTKTLVIKKHAYTPRKQEANDVVRAQWVYLYLVEGWTLRHIADEYGVSAPTVRSAIADTGAHLRPRGTRGFSR